MTALRVPLVAVLVSGYFAAFSEGATADALALQTVMARAGEYLMAYAKQFSATIAEERYLQQVVDRGGVTRQTRQLRSDVFMIWLPEKGEWAGFRAVLEVDGKALPDRIERLRKLFLQSPAEVLNRAREFADESARYNIGSIGRNINLPMMALDVVKPSNQSRFTFKESDEETIDGKTVWVIEFVEHDRPTLVRTSVGDIFSQGKLWIDPIEGRVVRSEFIIGSTTGDLRSDVVVTYRPDAGSGLWLPSRMDELHSRPSRPLSDRIKCTATYGNIRRPVVETQERADAPEH
ncbi:MAG: hypothetical protein HYX75_14755 [Acidobacteria bacterium]|nr:hypothetical protein [Acidobacteriota bacterium]